MYFSIIVPVYNRPEEIIDLLDSIRKQDFTSFEVIIIEDGSSSTCEDLILPYFECLNLTYVFQENTGQGFARNHGISISKGEFFVFFDSDCVVPNGYFNALKKAINARKLDAFGGPDEAGSEFSAFQKAMNFSMTSLWTTGGIRGKLKDPAKFQARGFNMGFSRKAFEKVGGFIDPNMAEDIEISMRIKKAGFRLELVREAFVYHRRKNTFISFLKQSFQFGRNRIHIRTYHPEAVQLVHALPVMFLAGLVAMPLAFIFVPILLSALASIYLSWSAGVLVSSTLANRSLKIGFLSLATSIGQLVAYGAGFIRQFLFR